MNPTSPSPKQQLAVWWVIWAAFQSGIVVIYYFLGRDAAATGSALAIWPLAFVPVLLSGAVRWAVLPMFHDAQKALPFFVLGLALAEVTCFLGIFVFPAHKIPLFAASVLGILQFMPLFATRYFDHPE